jgi:N5-(cytidine 5'-diphosphoramidyl)-L-glutamine hydrolase
MRVGVSMRADATGHGEMRDGIDHDLLRWLAAGGMTGMLLPNVGGDPADRVDTMTVDAWVLSGGGDHAARTATEDALLRQAVARGTPVLGLCHGLQQIQRFFGGTVQALERPEAHVGTSHPVRITAPWLQALLGADAGTVNSFHANGIAATALADALEMVAISADGWVEGAVHRTLPILGLMWHPERPGCDAAFATGRGPHLLPPLLEALRSR